MSESEVDVATGGFIDARLTMLESASKLPLRLEKRAKRAKQIAEMISELVGEIDAEEREEPV